MEDKKLEYINLILKCLKLDNKKYLFVSMPTFLSEYKTLINEEASKYNLKEIYFDEYDPFVKHDLLIKLDQENINKHPLFDKSIYNKYAKLDAAFLFIQSMVPNLMDDVDPNKLKDTNIHSRETQKYFRDLYEADKLSWCIAGIPNIYWARDGLKMSVNELWDLILDVCLVTGDNTSYDKWIKKLDGMQKSADKLNEYNFKYLHYTNSMGTNLDIYLPKNHIWNTGLSKLGSLCNLPTEEIFTSPQYDMTSGVVYASKPLFYNGVMITDFYLKFKQGKVIEYDAKEGKDVLQTIIENDDYSAFLGECALVSYDSPINNKNVLFKETLYDENASCHLALGTAFSECIKCDDDISIDELRNLGLNSAKIHVDFMIGTKDLKITGFTQDNEEIVIMENGNLII